MTDPELYTVEEVADLLRTTKKAVYLQAERGLLPGVVKLGRRLLFRRDDVRTHLGLASTKEAS